MNNDQARLNKFNASLDAAKAIAHQAVAIGWAEQGLHYAPSRLHPWTSDEINRITTRAIFGSREDSLLLAWLLSSRQVVATAPGGWEEF